MKRLRIVERRLGRERAHGQWLRRGVIELDSRLSGRFGLGILVHELLHEYFPDMSERQVARAATRISKGIWQMNYRRLAK